MPIHANASGTDLHEDKRIKLPARAASTANLTLASPGASIDGVTLVSGDRVLLKNQSAASQNGIYVWTGAASTLTRSADADEAVDFVHGFQVYVREGTLNTGTYWVFNQSAAITLGTTSITFSAGGGDPTTTRGDLIYRAASALARLAVGTVGKLLGSDGTDPIWTNDVQYLKVTGLTGAVTATRYVGGTASVAPTTGTFIAGDYVVTANGKVWICTTGGTPGTWGQVGADPTTTQGDMTVRGASTLDRHAIGVSRQFLGVTTSSNGIVWTNDSTFFKSTGLSGSTAGGRFVGATFAQQPTAGAYLEGDFITDLDGAMWICSANGTPGTWYLVGSRHVPPNPGGFGQALEIKTLYQTLTIAAAATTATTIQIPAFAVVLGVPVRVATVIPTAATFTVTATTSGTVFNTAAVSTAATSTDVGTLNCPFNSATTQTITITPDLTPGAATGVVRVTIFYYQVIAPSA